MNDVRKMPNEEEHCLSIPSHFIPQDMAIKCVPGYISMVMEWVSDRLSIDEFSINFRERILITNIEKSICNNIQKT